MTGEQRATAAKLVAVGLASRRLLLVRHFLPDDELYAVVKTEPRARPLESGPAVEDAASSAGSSRPT